MAVINSLASGVGQILGRTVLLQSNTANGVPVPLAVLDVVKDESVDYDAEVTEFPVEAGPEVTDHIQLLNPTIRLKGTISATPLDLSVALANIAAGALAAYSSSQARSNLLNSGLSQATGIVGSALQGNASSIGSSAITGAVDAVSRTILLNAYQSKTPFTLITKRMTYPNVVIKKLRFPRNEETGYALDFEMDIKQITITSTLSVQKTQTSEDVINSASSSTNLGSQTTAQASSQIQSGVQNSSLGSAPGMAAKFPSLVA